MSDSSPRKVPFIETLEEKAITKGLSEIIGIETRGTEATKSAKVLPIRVKAAEPAKKREDVVPPAVVPSAKPTDETDGRGSYVSSKGSGSKSSHSHISRRTLLSKIWTDPSRRVAYPGSWSLSSYSEWFRSI